MKPSLRNVSIGWRVALALALPSLAMLAFGWWATLSQYRNAVEAGRVRGMVEFAAVVNSLVHAIQTERAISTAVIGSRRGEFDQALKARQLETDLVRTRFVQVLKELEAARLSDDLEMQAALARQVVDRIDVWRSVVEQRGITAPMLIESYAAVVADLMRVVQEMLVLKNQPDLVRALSAYSRLMQAKEFAGMERALGVAGFGGGGFDRSTVKRMVELIDRQRLLLDEFRFLAGPSQSDWLDRGWAGVDTVALDEMRQGVVEAPSLGAIRNVALPQWLNVTTRRIDLLRDAEVRISSQLQQQARELESTAIRAAIGIASAMALALVASALVAAVLGRDIIRPLQRITQAMRRLAERREVSDIEEDGRTDEIGDMVHALQVFKQNLVQVVQAEAQLKGAVALREKERYQRALLDSFPFMVWLKDTNSRFMAVNQAVADSYGVANPDQLVGKTEFDLLDYETASRIRDEDQSVMQTRQNSVLELQRVMAPDSEPRWVEVYKAPVTDDFGAVLGTVGFIRDITERKLQQEEIRQLALYDPLTQLPNRRLFSERVNHAIALARRDQARLALVFVDLDRFKPVNDSLGHAVGDLLLRAVARRMQQCVREADTIGRVGGDEFEVLLPTIDDAEQALVVAEKIRQALNQPFELTGGYVVSISSSSGVAIYPEDGEDENTLSRAADAAMYRAKALGRDNVQCYQPGLVM
ncbi:MAG: hypothetical protein RLZ81_2706 [Pseudomonadota bacterium]|jgi:diguanylate cyclase (GGDEF)-like protein/PAS domain S-box-containing protein